MSNETLGASNNTAETTGYDELINVKFAGEKTDKKAEIIEALASKRPNYKKIVKDLRQLNSPEIEAEAFNTRGTGAPLLFLYSADKFMPTFSSEEKEIPSIAGDDLQERLAQRTMEDHPNTENTLEDYKNAISGAQELYKRSYKTIPVEDREAWKQTLCVNALSESAGTDTREAFRIMLALSNGADFSKPILQLQGNTVYDARESYMLNDIRVRTVVLRYSKRGPEFFQKMMGDSPSPVEQKILNTELARRKEREERLAKLREV